MSSLMVQVSPDAVTTPPRRLRHIRELDGVRGIAALMVLCHHTFFTALDGPPSATVPHILYTLSIFGSAGVDLFFALSGFLITALLIEARESPCYYQDFYWKRALRILPLYLVCLLGVLVFIPGSRAYVLLSIFFISNFARPLHIVGAGPFWTLAIEEQFYLIWPTVVRRKAVETLRLWAVVVGVGAILFRFVDAWFGHYNFQFTFFRCDALAFGALVACWHTRRDSERPLSPREGRVLASGGIAGVLCLAASNLPVTNFRLFALVAACRQTGITLVCCVIVAYLVSHTGRRRFAWLRSPALTFFGLISYAMYMIHLYVIMAYDHHFGAPAPEHALSYTVRAIAIFAVTVILCLISRYLIELPATSLRKYVLSRPGA